MATQGFAAGRRQRDLAAAPRPSAVPPKRLFLGSIVKERNPEGLGTDLRGWAFRRARQITCPLMSYSDLFEGGSLTLEQTFFNFL